jgi:hypothetical protein
MEIQPFQMPAFVKEKAMLWNASVSGGARCRTERALEREVNRKNGIKNGIHDKLNPPAKGGDQWLRKLILHRSWISSLHVEKMS